MLVGFALCGTVLYRNHQGKGPQRRFREILKSFNLAEEKSRWQLRVTLGVSGAVLVGELLGLPRIMWVGFACSSTLSVYGTHPIKRMVGRLGGVLSGSLLFCLVYVLCPAELQGSIGIGSGLCLGLCASYGACTMFNCLSALLTASVLFGPGPAVAIRIFNNLLGCLFGVVFFWFWNKTETLLERRDPKKSINSPGC